MSTDSVVSFFLVASSPRYITNFLRTELKVAQEEAVKAS